MASYEECMSCAQECVRLAGLTDDRAVRDEIIERARAWIRRALRMRDAGARVIVLPPKPA
jgi:hypothetical protein